VTQLRPILSQAYENLMVAAMFNPAGGRDKESGLATSAVTLPAAYNRL
jgi:hypothetical protein